MRLIRFFKKLFFHPDPKKRTIITAVYCGTGIIANFFWFQVFCMPVFYAGLMLVAFLVSVLWLPFIVSSRLLWLAYFFAGAGVPMCIYCFLFLCLDYDSFFGGLIFIGMFLGGVGVLAFIPVYLLWHIRCYYRAAQVMYKRALLAGVFVPLAALGVYITCFHSWAVNVGRLQARCATKDELVMALPSDYFTERILGLHWKYHTRVCIYDGWRPPLHDPFLIVGLYGIAFFGPHPFLGDCWPCYNWEARKYYSRKFPSRALKVWCPCSYNSDGMGYLRSPMDTVKRQHSD